MLIGQRGGVLDGLQLTNNEICLVNQLNPNKITFWDKNQRGANIFNRVVTKECIQKAKKYGIKFVRLAPDKFLSAERDFLIGNADAYTKIPEKDLTQLKQVLDLCAQEAMPVVLTMLSLPGSRWRQNNDFKDDLRLWQDKLFQQQAAKFWRELAHELKNHPAVVGYNLLNEPHLEKIYNELCTSINQEQQKLVQKNLFEVYDLLITEIRKVDTQTPIILDSSLYGDPKAFKYFTPHIAHSNIIYSFHMYEPFHYTNYKINQERFTYPGMIEGSFWDKKALEDYMLDVGQFQKMYGIASNRILVGEFGAHRKSKGLVNYFSHLIEIFTKQDWHFAFYAFEEDTWDGMDYELDATTSWQDSQQKSKLNHTPNNPVFNVLTQALN